MTATAQYLTPAQATPSPIVPIDPDSDFGKAVAKHLSEVIDGAVDRMRREGKPVPELHGP